MDLADRVVGSCLGLAIGDALGAPFEGLRAHRIPNPFPAFELGRQGREPGSTTDDTAMARNLMRSLAGSGGFDAADLVECHLDWFRSGPPEAGALIRRVLARVARGEDAAAVARDVWESAAPRSRRATAR
jgi:ADP-ribosylglycohydrolase